MLTWSLLTTSSQINIIIIIIIITYQLKSLIATSTTNRISHTHTHTHTQSNNSKTAATPERIGSFINGTHKQYVLNQIKLQTEQILCIKINNPHTLNFIY